MANTTLADRSVIRLSGDDVRGFLQGLVTNDVMGTLPVWAALLSAQGKCLFDFFVWADGADGAEGADVLIDCEALRAAALVKRLSRYRLRRSITIAIDPGYGVGWSLTPVDDTAPDPRLGELGYRWLSALEDGASDGAADYRAHRLALGVTEGVAELGDGTTLWLECNAAELNGVSFSKGCYVGQENTARMNWRSTVNRRMCVVPLADTDPKRQVVAYPDLGLSVEHRRVDAIPAHGWRDWMGKQAEPSIKAT